MKLLRIGIACLALLCSSVSVASGVDLEIPWITGGNPASYFVSDTPNADTSVFMIGVYETVDRGGTATVNIGEQYGRDTVLVLSSYEPTQWNVTGDGVDDVSRVLLYGYNEQTITGFDRLDLVSEYSYEGQTRNYQGNTYAYPGDGRVVSHVRSQTGLNVDAFAGAYSSNQFAIAAQTAPVPEPSSSLVLMVGLLGLINRRRK